MNNCINILITAVFALGITSSAQADPTSKVPASWRGTGCPSESTSSKVGVSEQRLTIFFSAYDVGKNAKSGLKRATCSFAFSVTVPKGFQILSQMTWKGVVSGRIELKQKAFLSGRPLGSWKTSVHEEPMEGSFTHHETFRSDPTAPCRGGIFNIRVNSQISTKPSDYGAILQLSHSAQLVPCL